MLLWLDYLFGEGVIHYIKSPYDTLSSVFAGQCCSDYNFGQLKCKPKLPMTANKFYELYSCDCDELTGTRYRIFDNYVALAATYIRLLFWQKEGFSALAP